MWTDLTTPELIDAIRKRRRRQEPLPLDLVAEATSRGLIVNSRL